MLIHIDVHAALFQCYMFTWLNDGSRCCSNIIWHVSHFWGSVYLRQVTQI